MLFHCLLFVEIFTSLWQLFFITPKPILKRNGSNIRIVDVSLYLWFPNLLFICYNFIISYVVPYYTLCLLVHYVLTKMASVFIPKAGYSRTQSKSLYHCCLLLLFYLHCSYYFYYPILSYLILSYLILYYIILSYLILYYPFMFLYYNFIAYLLIYFCSFLIITLFSPDMMTTRWFHQAIFVILPLFFSIYSKNNIMQSSLFCQLSIYFLYLC